MHEDDERDIILAFLLLFFIVPKGSTYTIIKCIESKVQKNKLKTINRKKTERHG